MSKGKHPILVVLIILGVIVVFLGTLMAVLLKMFGPSPGISFGDRIGVIPIEGVISNSESILSQLVDFKKDKRIKAIILRIDSPGGGVGPSQEIYREVRKAIKTKKVVASMGGVAASGGYYVAAAANKIIANPGTITGSIGVIMEFIQIEDLIKKIGVGLEVVKSGEFKDVGSPHRKLSEKDRQLIKELISDIQSQFVNAVAEGRSLPVEKVLEIADGRILSGAQAEKLGLVDRLGNFQDAVDLAKKMSGVTGEATLVFPEKPGLGLWDLVLQSTVKILIRDVKNSLRTRIEYRWDGFS